MLKPFHQMYYPYHVSLPIQLSLKMHTCNVMLEAYIAEYSLVDGAESHVAKTKTKNKKTNKNNNKTTQLPADYMLEMSLMYDATWRKKVVSVKFVKITHSFKWNVVTVMITRRWSYSISRTKFRENKHMYLVIIRTFLKTRGTIWRFSLICI